jgi:hypothetical protein
MNKLFFTAIIVLLLSLSAIAQVKNVVILDPIGSTAENLKNSVFQEVLSVAKTNKDINIIERPTVIKALAENHFRVDLNTHDSKFCEIGKVLKAKYVFVITVSDIVKNNYSISCKVIDVAKSNVLRQSSVQTKNGEKDLTANTKQMMRDLLDALENTFKQTDPTQKNLTDSKESKENLVDMMDVLKKEDIAAAKNQKEKELAEVQAKKAKELADAQAQKEKALADEKARQDRELAAAQAQKEKELADAKAQKERELAEAKAKQDKEFAEAKVRQERELAEAQAQREKALAEEKARQERELAEAQAQKEKELAEAKAQKEKELAEAKAKQEKEFAEAKAKQEKEFAEAKAKQERELAEAQAQKEKEIAEAKAQQERELAEAKAQKEKELALLQAQQEQELAEARAKQEKELADTKAKELELVKAKEQKERELLELQAQQAKELAEAKAKQDKEIAETKAKEKELVEAKAQKEKELAMLQAQKEKELAEAKAKEKELAEAKAQKDRELAEAKAQKEKELAEALAQKEKELAELQAQKEKELAAAKAQQEKELAAAKAQQEKELAAAKVQQEKELAAAKAQQEKEIAEAKAKQEKEIAEAKAQQEKEIAEAKAQKEKELAEAKAQQEKELAEVKAKQEKLKAEEEKRQLQEKITAFFDQIPDTVSFVTSGGKKMFPAYYDKSSWNESELPSWCSLQSTKDALVLTCTPNTNPTLREGYFYLYADNLSKKIWVKQMGKATLVLSLNKIDFSDSGGTREILVSTNNPSWKVTGNPSWCAINTTDNKIYLDCAANSSGKRSFMLEVRAGEQLEKIQVSQKEYIFIILSDSTLEFSSSGGSRTINVNTNASSWDVSNELSWCPMAKTGNSIIFSCRSNLNTYERIDQLTIIADYATKILPIKQRGITYLEKGNWKSAINKVVYTGATTYENAIYKGEKSNKGIRTGLGAYFFIADNESYWGEFLQGESNGKGIYIIGKEGDFYFSGCRGCKFYAGNWSSDMKNGLGKCYDKKGDLLYFGYYQNEKPLETFPQTYEESYKFESVEYSNGDMYLGETYKGYLHGLGIFFWANGAAWYGEWKDGKRDGTGIEFLRDGSIKTGRWFGDTYFE